MDRPHPECSGLWGVLGVGHGTGGARDSGGPAQSKGLVITWDLGRQVIVVNITM